VGSAKYDQAAAVSFGYSLRDELSWSCDIYVAMAVRGYSTASCDVVYSGIHVPNFHVHLVLYDVTSPMTLDVYQKRVKYVTSRDKKTDKMHPRPENLYLFMVQLFLERFQ
jgi:hypothetical protein